MSTIFPSSFSLRFNPHRLTGAIDWHGHLNFAAWLLEQVRPQNLVELGVFRGDSLAAFAQAARELKLDLSITGIDSWAGDDTTGRYSEQVYSDVKDYFDATHPGVTLYRGLFDAALLNVPDSSVDILHIDGSHYYEDVKHDFVTWLPKLSNRGIILFHDIAVVSGGFGTKKLWDEIKGLYPSFSFNHSNGLGVLLFGSEQPLSLLQLAIDDDNLDLVRATFEIAGSKFFHMAKEKYWKLESDRHAAYVTHVTGDIGKALSAIAVENISSGIQHFLDTESQKNTISAIKIGPKKNLAQLTKSIIHRIGL